VPALSARAALIAKLHSKAVLALSKRHPETAATALPAAVLAAAEIEAELGLAGLRN
jgi:hypothetical protein